MKKPFHTSHALKNKNGGKMARKLEPINPENKKMKLKNKTLSIKEDVMSSAKTIVTFVLDESGSMSTVKESTVKGFNNYVDELRKDEDTTELNLISFNGLGLKLIANSVDIREFSQLSVNAYNPTSDTPLYDAVCEAINHTEKIANSATDDTRIVITIMTDGMENSSQEYTGEHVRKMISEKQEKNDWDFIFLGANQNSWETGENLGVRRGYSSNYANDNPEDAFRKSSESLLRLKRLYREGKERPDYLFHEDLESINKRGNADEN